MSQELHVSNWLTTKYFKEETSESAKSIGFGVVFSEKSEIFDIDLEYKLMCTSSSVRTSELFSNDFYGKGYSGDAYIQSGIPVLQWYIEKALLEMILGESVPFELELHSFPYPKDLDLQRDEKTFITILLPLFTMIGFIFFVPIVIRRIVQEKSTGVKELMRIVGLNSLSMWISWLLYSILMFAVTTMLVTVILGVNFTKGQAAFLDFVDLSLLWSLYFLFCVASLIFCFAITAVFNNPVAAMSCGVIMWIGTFTLLNPLVLAEHVPWLLRLIICLFPTAAITTGFNVIRFYDNRREFLSWDKIIDKCPFSTYDMHMGWVFFMLLFDIVFYSVITWYLDCVKPGPFGIAKPWNFCFQRLKKKKCYSSKQKFMGQSTYEEPLPYLKVGIFVKKVKKIYKSEMVGLDGVTMNIYQDVITVLLGHNGAGKTSLMGILSGLYSATSGNIYFRGEDIFSDLKKFRRNLGICFQYNYLFTYLTVMEHFIFFGVVKGMSFHKAREEGQNMLQLMHLMDVQHSYIDTLSGGTLRKVSLSIALIGNPKVLLLDEPTLGMDPETRRDVWDLILRKRGNHTIIITTQFMEEADVLGDWIAILDHGRVVCYGTTPFLKKLYGTGYHLTITTDKNSDKETITGIVREIIPNYTKGSVLPTQIDFNLPMEETHKFPELFANLETRKSELGIGGIGIQCTTIEEVFLKVGEMLQDPNSSTFTGYLLANFPKLIRRKDNLTGKSLRFQQFKALLVKKSLFDIRNFMLLLLMTIVPVLIVLITFPQSVSTSNRKTQPPLHEVLSMYDNSTVFYSIVPVEGMEAKFKSLDASLNSIITKQHGRLMHTENVTNSLSEFGSKYSVQYTRHTIVSLAVDKYTVTAFFSNHPAHAVPISINLVSNVLLKFYLPDINLNISLIYIPVDISALENTCIQASLNLGENIGHQWAVSMPQCLLCIMTVFILLPAVERSTSCKHLQLMTGVSPYLYWGACFVWDFFLYCIVTLLCVTMIILPDKHHIFTSLHNTSILILILLLYGISGTTFAYFSSSFGSSTSKIVGNYIVISICFGLVTAIGMNVALRAEYSGDSIIPPGLLRVLEYLLPLCPHYCLVSAITYFGGGVYQSFLCKNCPQHNCNDERLLVFNSKENKYGLLLELIYLSTIWILYLILVLMADKKVFNKLYWKIKDMMMDTDIHEENMDLRSDVRKEVEKTLLCTRNRNVDPKAVFLTIGLGKKFSSKSVIVRPMSFRLRKGECFGLLGKNGAGKSSTFRMLVGELIPTCGDAVSYNATLRKNTTQYLKKIGYCPQIGALNLSFTGEETLRLFAQLRGIHPKRVETEVDNWIRLLGLSDHRSFLCATYSSGTRRKLSTAVALIGYPPIVFLDEPTAGVDPFGRRNLWEILNASKDMGQAILLTSHSMRECEALCGRLTIMVDGQLVCLGNTQYLKKKFGQGYTVLFVLHTVRELQEMIPALKAEMYKLFSRVKLKDEHKKALHFHIKDENIKLSQLFGTMEQLKKSFPVIESYALGNTTLEQVFISFAKTHIKPEIII
ncbi:phospholipid-transporting ATPase ABCA3-like [Homalodisca vitripennis]|uniref:phospholipid-transporting ATPase ABCA3-like n=1 Tax=Homalodisca vitripennis TaxID=197043 RepID=UPI001EEB5D0F|nr:phospholipid-transporting ATPase ABCA3-like [Homalodisca vitripennis]